MVRKVNPVDVRCLESDAFGTIWHLLDQTFSEFAPHFLVGKIKVFESHSPAVRSKYGPRGRHPAYAALSEKKAYDSASAYVGYARAVTKKFFS